MELEKSFVPLRWQARGPAAYTISAPARGCFFLEGKKWAHPHINKGMIGMQRTREERLKEFLREIRQELDCVAQKRGLYTAVVRNYVAIQIKLLMEDDFVSANTRLKFAHRMLTDPFAQDDVEDFHEALCAFDLGFFVASLWAHFDDEIEAMAKAIWDSRQEFLPYMAEALRVAYLFSIYLKDGTKPRWAFYYALKSTNYMCVVFDYCSIYYNKCIGEVLPVALQNKLKQILYAYAHKCKRGGAPEA